MVADVSIYKLVVDDVLYEFDEPILFVAKVGFLKSLFLKTADLENKSEYLSCYIDDAHVDALKDGRISVRGVFDAQKEKYLVYTDELLHVVSERLATAEELNEDRLPEPMLGIYPRLGVCPDVMQEKDALLSVYFTGANLSRDSIAYSTLMSILGRVQTLARNVIAPPELRGLRNNTFDFMVGDPALGSLMISIKEPTANLHALRRGDRKNMTMDEVREGVSRTKDEFFAGVSELIEGTSPKGDGDYFKEIQDILPSAETPYSNVVLSTKSGTTFKRLVITRERADQVRAVRSNLESGYVTRTGRIIEINAGSRTILIRSRAGVITTCAFDKDTFDILGKNPDFVIGARAALAGELFRRVRRDYMNVEKVISVERRKSRT